MPNKNSLSNRGSRPRARAISKTGSRIFIVVTLCAAALAVIAGIHVISTRLAGSHTLLTASETVLIDPGHGGEDGGAVGAGGVVEKNINLAISLQLRDFFQQAGYHVVMTRETDCAIYDSGCTTLRQKKTSDLHNRLKIIEEYPDSVFISVHQNKFGQSRYSGTQVFYSKNNPLSKVLAQSIQSDVRGLLQPANNREIKEAQKNLYLLYNAPSPAVLVECGFLSNPEEAAKLQTADYQNRMAFSIFYATLHYQAEKNKPSEPEVS